MKKPKNDAPKRQYGRHSALRDVPGIESSFMEIVGNRRLEIDGCRGIIEYGSQKICLRVARMKVTICGCDLLIRVMTGDSIILEGVITGVEFSS